MTLQSAARPAPQTPRFTKQNILCLAGARSRPTVKCTAGEPTPQNRVKKDGRGGTMFHCARRNREIQSPTDYILMYAMNIPDRW